MACCCSKSKMNDIIQRLHRNHVKQKEYRHIVRGRGQSVSYNVAKRQADIYFLKKYAHLTLKELGKMFKVSYQRVHQIMQSLEGRFYFKICHPKKSCL
jgi:DNA-directed RNA polymerase sigma subunit (sigma70/sigma32)